MKTSIDFLPEHKQKELKLIVETIENRYSKVNMIILYGSYARNTWIEDKYVENGTTYEYISDYDLMIVLSSENKARKTGFQIDLRQRIADLGIKTPISLIFHGYPYICQMLAEKQYFFCDVYNEGIILSNVWNREFKEPSDISYELRAEKASDYFEEWFGSASDFLGNYYYNFEQEKYKLASFNLHQSAERFYMCALLIFTDYKGKTHDLEILDKACSDEDSRFRQAFPRISQEEKDLFQLLRESYIGSRYIKNFKITKEELEYLAGRVEVLKKLVDSICNEKIEYFKEIAKKYPGKIIESKKPNFMAENNYGSEMKRIDPDKETKLIKVKEEGRKEGIKEIAMKMLEKGLDIEVISEMTGLKMEEIDKLNK